MTAKGEVQQLNFGFRKAAEDGNPIPSFSRQELLNTSKAVCNASKDETSTYSKISHLLNHG